MHPSEPTQQPVESPAAADTAESGAPAETRATPPPPPPGKTSFWKELPFLVLIALVLALLIKTFLVQAFYIPSSSMENTLQGGPNQNQADHKKHPYDRVLVNKLIYRIRDIHRGEIVVFKGPPSWQETPEFVSHTPSNPIGRFFHDIGSAIGVAAPSSKDFIKRVIGVGGDTVRCTNDQLYVNNVRLVEPYIYPGAHQCNANGFDGSVTVPKGRLWVMGDNRDGSADSRLHRGDHDGTIPASDVIGRAFVVVWPPSDWKTLPVPGTFHQKGLAAALAATSDPLVLGFVGAVPLTLLRRRVAHRRRVRRSRRPAAS
ncbi:MAG: signal peptidase [Frankiaceae bacterium]|nr:signal peptidase [Frankiaceae bacterium]